MVMPKSFGDFECESKLMESHECQNETVDCKCTLYLSNEDQGNHALLKIEY